MSEAATVRPMAGNILDIWEDMMRPFEVGEGEVDNQEKDTSGKEQEEGDADEAISVEEEEGMEVNVGKLIRAPTKEEVAMHMVNHIQFRSSCSHCVKGKAHGNHHRRRKAIEGEDREPVVSVDYMFMHDNQGEGEEKGMPIMVIKD